MTAHNTVAADATYTCVTGGSFAWSLIFAKLDATTKDWSIVNCIGGFDDGADGSVQMMRMDPNGQAIYAAGYSMNSYIPALGTNYTSPRVDVAGLSAISDYAFYDAFVFKFDLDWNFLYY